MWYRVFGTHSAAVNPSELLEEIQANDYRVRSHFRGDDEGWFHVQMETGGEPLEIQRYLVTEEGIRAELNTWAAWLESMTQQPTAVALMQPIIGTQQLFTIECPDEHEGAGLCEVICRWLAKMTNGVYQIDGQGFFDAQGLLLVAE